MHEIKTITFLSSTTVIAQLSPIPLSFTEKMIALARTELHVIRNQNYPMEALALYKNLTCDTNDRNILPLNILSCVVGSLTHFVIQSDESMKIGITLLCSCC